MLCHNGDHFIGAPWISSRVLLEENIRREIGQKVKEVDLVIDVLISAGMTSPALRAAQARVLSLQELGTALFWRFTDVGKMYVPGKMLLNV